MLPAFTVQRFQYGHDILRFLLGQLEWNGGVVLMRVCPHHVDSDKIHRVGIPADAKIIEFLGSEVEDRVTAGAAR